MLLIESLRRSTALNYKHCPYDSSLPKWSLNVHSISIGKWETGCNYKDMIQLHHFTWELFTFSIKNMNLNMSIIILCNLEKSSCLVVQLGEILRIKWRLIIHTMPFRFVYQTADIYLRYLRCERKQRYQLFGTLFWMA